MYIIPLIPFKFLTYDFEGKGLIFIRLLIYLIMLFSIIWSYKKYNNKANLLLGVISGLFLVISFLLFCLTFMTHNQAFDVLIMYIGWLITYNISKIFLCIYFSKIFGWKNVLTCAGILLLMLILLNIL